MEDDLRTSRPAEVNGVDTNYDDDDDCLGTEMHFSKCLSLYITFNNFYLYLLRLVVFYFCCSFWLVVVDVCHGLGANISINKKLHI